MSKINCNVAQDLLPLYAEKMVSDDTKALVDEHLNECEYCKSELVKMNSKIKVKSNTDTDFLKKIKKKITRKNLISLSILLSCLLGLIVLINPLVQQVYYRYLYMGNRLNVTLNLCIDGVDYGMEDISVECVHDGVSQQIFQDDKSFSAKADDYGPYRFKVMCQDTEITIDLYQANWWNIQNFSLSADVDTTEECLFYHITGTYIREDLSKGSYYDKDMIIAENNVYNINARIL